MTSNRQSISDRQSSGSCGSSGSLQSGQGIPAQRHPSCSKGLVRVPFADPPHTVAARAHRAWRRDISHVFALLAIEVTT